MAAEEAQPGVVSPVDRVLEKQAAERAWEDAQGAWSVAPKEGKAEALAESLRVCAEHAPGILGDVFQRGLDAGRPVAEQKAFAAQLALLAEHDPRKVESLYRGIVKRPGRTPGLVKAALSGVRVLRDRDPDAFALLVAETMVIFGKDKPEWSQARSVLFEGSHSGHGAYTAIEPALRSEEEEVRRMTARHLLPELATKAQYGKEILDMIEGRFDRDDDPITLCACLRVLPDVYRRRPSQGKRIVGRAFDHTRPEIREEVRRVMQEAGMADKLPPSP